LTEFLLDYRLHKVINRTKTEAEILLVDDGDDDDGNMLAEQERGAHLMTVHHACNPMAKIRD
jgi:hypothetical protein